MNQATIKHSKTVAAVDRLTTSVKMSFKTHWMASITNLLGALVGGRQSCEETLSAPDFSSSVRLFISSI